jgi:hypothetical protein
MSYDKRCWSESFDTMSVHVVLLSSFLLLRTVHTDSKHKAAFYSGAFIRETATDLLSGPTSPAGT